jgi:hypothetical protein
VASIPDPEKYPYATADKFAESAQQMIGCNTVLIPDGNLKNAMFLSDRHMQIQYYD